MQVETKICLEMVSQIQRFLDHCDVISLVFLLYESPQTALRQLIVYQRLSREIGVNSANLLLDWAIQEQSDCTWKWKLLEALATCQLFSVIRSMGFEVPTRKNHQKNLFLKMQNMNYVNPVRRVIYSVCENMDSLSLNKIKQILVRDYNIAVTDEEESYEIIFLRLMCGSTTSSNYENKDVNQIQLSVREIVNVLDQIQEFESFSTELKYLAGIDINQKKHYSICSSQKACSKTCVIDEGNGKETRIDDLDETFTLLNQLILEDVDIYIKNDNS